MRTPTPKGADVEVELPKKARVSWEWPWMSPWGGASIGASPYESKGTSNGSSRMVELVCGLPI